MKRRTFRYKLVTLFLASIMLPMIVMGSSYTLYYNDQSSRAGEQNIINTLYTVSENIRIYLDDLKRLSISPSVYPDIINYYNLINNGSNEINYQNYLYERNYRQIMRRQLLIFREDIRGIAFIPQNNPSGGVHVIDMRLGSTSTTIGYDYLNKDWYPQVIAHGGSAVFAVADTLEYYDSVTNNGPMVEKPVIEEGLFSVIRLVHHDSTRAVLGIIKVDASSQVIKDVLDNIETSENSGLLLLDSNGRVIHSTKDELKNLAPMLSLGQTVISTSADSYRCYTKTIGDTGWQLVYLDSNKDIFGKTRNVVLVFMALSSACIMVGFAIFNVFSNRITKPVRVIVDTMREVEQQNLGARCEIPEYANREFTMISDELNNMIEKLENLINSEYKAVISQKNAEFLALQRQINPHFLYNTLNGFITLNRLEDKKKLEQSILQLTALFRYTCSNVNITTIAEEMRFIEMYLTLQQLRFEDRLQFSLHVDEAVKDVAIPRLLLQPLAENAIIHGMEPSDKEFLLELYALHIDHPLLGSMVIITVRDNGVGFDAKQSHEGNRVGFQNVDERLELFKEGGTLHINSTPNVGTICQIILPFDN